MCSSSNLAVFSILTPPPAGNRRPQSVLQIGDVKRRRSCDLSTSLVRNFHILTAVSGAVSPILDIWTQNLAAVKSYQGEDEYFDKDDESEDSDCDSNPEVHSESTSKRQDGKKKALERESLPVVTVGSFSRYVQFTVAGEQSLLTFLVAGYRCSSICAQIL